MALGPRKASETAAKRRRRVQGAESLALPLTVPATSPESVIRPAEVAESAEKIMIKR